MSTAIIEALQDNSGEMITISIDFIRDGWADYHLLGHTVTRDDAEIVARAAINRMIYPTKGDWQIEIKDTETGETSLYGVS